jgi:hypothetical protein
MAALADQAGNAALDFGRGGLADYGNFKLILLAGDDQTGFVQCRYHPVTRTLQYKVPGSDNRGIDASTENQRHAGSPFRMNLAGKSGEILPRASLGTIGKVCRFNAFPK